ncbi:MAG TPA: hypothetical protein PJ982_03630 [Lacipirellulaceae bacterium]|nr:hypothetical protein [Lacipirellulaceae bacterium]
MPYLSEMVQFRVRPEYYAVVSARIDERPDETPSKVLFRLRAIRPELFL